MFEQMLKVDSAGIQLYNNRQAEKQKKQVHLSNTIQQNEFQEELTMIQKATLIIDGVTNLLCSEIYNGSLIIQDQQQKLPIQRKIVPIRRNLSIQLKLEEVDLEQHRKKVKSLMRFNKIIRSNLANRTLQIQKSIKQSQQEQKRIKQLEKAQQLEKRRELIQKRMNVRSQMVKKIKQMSIQADQNLKNVTKAKFLYQQTEEIYKSKYLLPKIQEEKKILQKRKHRMKSIDVKQLIEHEKGYEQKLKTSQINRSMTYRFMKSQNLYKPPQYTPKSYLIYQAQQQLKRDQQQLRARQIEINKQRVQQFAKNISSIHKMQHQIQRFRSVSPKQQQDQIQQKNKLEKCKTKILSKQEMTNVGNQYFRSLLQQIRKAKQKRQLRTRLKQEQLKRKKQEEQRNQNPQEDLQIQIRSEQIRRVQKIQKIQRIHKIRSKKIEKIFNDKKIDPLLKYQQLRHEVDKFDMILKSKKSQSADVNQRTEAAGCYLDAIKAKLKLLQMSNNK